MVAFDRDRWSAREADAFDHIGVERALRQEICTADFLGFFVKYVDEFRANEFAFRLGVGDTRQARHKAFFSVHDNKRDVIMVAEQGFDLFAFIHAQQAMVNKDASQLRADRLVNEDCGHRAIDAARQSANDSA